MSRPPFLLSAHCRVAFATVDQARDILGRRDEFVERLDLFERAAFPL